MTEINKKILNLILEGYDLNRIASELNLSKKQVYQRLERVKNSGYNLGCTVLDYGTLSYEVLNGLYEPASHTAKIKLVKDPQKFTAMVISDLHVGSTRDSIYRLDLIYEYCKNNGINVIINCGDLIDGLSKSRECYLDTYEKQIDALIKLHPYDSYIINLVCFGNHDYTALTRCGLDISKVLCANRPDFISLGYGYGIINLLNSQIIVNHRMKESRVYYERQEKFTGKILLNGHQHKMYTNASRYKICVNVPTLSDVIFKEQPTLPGAIKMEVNFNGSDTFDNVFLEHLVVTDKVSSAATYNYSFSNAGTILTEDEIGLGYQKTLMR